VNDARAMTTTLRGLGFDVISRENIEEKAMRQAILEFGDKLRDGRRATTGYRLNGPRDDSAALGGNISFLSGRRAVAVPSGQPMLCHGSSAEH